MSELSWATTHATQLCCGSGSRGSFLLSESPPLSFVPSPTHDSAEWKPRCCSRAQRISRQGNALHHRICCLPEASSVSSECTRGEMRLFSPHPHWGPVSVLPVIGTSSSLLCLHRLATFGFYEAAGKECSVSHLVVSRGHLITHQDSVNGIFLPSGPVTSQLGGTWGIIWHPRRGYLWSLQLRDINGADRHKWLHNQLLLFLLYLFVMLFPRQPATTNTGWRKSYATFTRVHVFWTM